HTISLHDALPISPAPVDERIVVSEIGVQWSPSTDPAKTAANVGNNKLTSDTSAVSMAIGNMIPNVPQDVPDASDIKLAIKKNSNGRNPGLMFELSTSAAKYSHVFNVPIIEPIIQANSNIYIAGSIVLNPSTNIRHVFARGRFCCK